MDAETRGKQQAQSNERDWQEEKRSDVRTHSHYLYTAEFAAFGCLYFGFCLLSNKRKRAVVCANGEGLPSCESNIQNGVTRQGYKALKVSRFFFRWWIKVHFLLYVSGSARYLIAIFGENVENEKYEKKF